MISADIETILRKHPAAKRDSLIPILQEVQESQGFLSREAVIRVSRHLGLPASKIYGVATFYNQFRFAAPGKFHIQLCRGTACHVKGSAALLDAVGRMLGIGPGQTTRDGLFSLEVVACIGACGLAPVICVNGEFFAAVTAEKAKEVIDSCRASATPVASAKATAAKSGDAKSNG
jgi:NADH-quinone oxidoreductase subunit E